MGTKLINRLKKYLTNIWLIEVCIVMLLGYYSLVKILKDYQGYLESSLYKSYLIIIAILLFKFFIAIVAKRGKIRIRGNFIATIIYVLQNGFKCKETRKILMTTIVVSIVSFIGYLYMLAEGGQEKNLLVTFFSLYPFKGSLFLMSLPMIGIIFSIKKTLEISMVNKSLEKINQGELDYDIVRQGGPEIIELIENITKIKDGYQIAVNEALKNEKLKTELISNVSHDLRTPLTSIINYVNILQDSDKITEEERKEYLQILDKKSKKLKVLIDDLFEASKINSRKIELNKEKIDIVSLIHQGIGEYSTLYEEKGLEFRVDTSQEEIFVELDGNMISRAIENIIINAIKYSLNNTRIYVDIKTDDEYLIISFKNIANYDMNFDNEEIFERFVRGDKSRNSNVEGSGLGLAITRSIVEVHDGVVKIKREGDMFKIFIYLPMNLDK